MSDNPFVCPDCGEPLVLRFFYVGYDEYAINPDGSKGDELFDSDEIPDDRVPEVWCPSCGEECAEFVYDRKQGKVLLCHST